MNDIEKMMSNLDPKVLNKIKSFARSSEGQKIISQLSSLNKDELLKKVSSMSEEEKNAVLSKLSKDPSLADTLKNLH